MDPALNELAVAYRRERGATPTAADAIRDLYRRYIRQREQTLLDAAAAAAAVGALFDADQIDFSAITPQMARSFELAFPNLDIASLSEYSGEKLAGIMSAWKGKYFEVIVADRLNEGQWVGDLHLVAGQTAELAENVTQPGWDLLIRDADGTVAQEIQLKATQSLSYVKQALERYPDIKIVSTDEVAGEAGELQDLVSPSGVSDESLESALRAPMEDLLDSPLEELTETVLPALPFVLIAVGEGRKVMVGKQSLSAALASGTFRVAKTTTAIAAGGLLTLIDCGVLSIPAAFLTRLGFDRHTVMTAAAKEMDRNIASLKALPC